MAAKKNAKAKDTSKAAPEAKAPAKEKKAKSTRTKVSADDFLIEDPTAGGPTLFQRKFDDTNKGDVYMQMARDARDSVEHVTNLSKSRPVALARPAALRSRLFPMNEPFMEFMFGAAGFHSPRSWEVVAPHSTGKTTWVFHMIGKVMSMGCPVLYLECENKRMDSARIIQLLHRDKKTAMTLFNALHINDEPITELKQCDDYIKAHVPAIRAKCDKNPATAGLPIFVFVDTWTALKTADEAKGNSDYGVSESGGNGKSKAKAKAKDIGDASNLGHAKHAAALRRYIPGISKTYNANIIFMTHQQEKINMTAIPGMPPTPSWKNDTSRGGRGLKQFTSYVMTMVAAGNIQDAARNHIGHHVRFSLTKNSYGPPFRSCYASIYTAGKFDSETEHAAWFTFADKTAEWMANNKLLGTKVSNNLYTCDSLGCIAVSADELYAALMNDHEKRDFVLSNLGVFGYAAAAARSEILSSQGADELTDEDEQEDPDGAES